MRIKTERGYHARIITGLEEFEAFSGPWSELIKESGIHNISLAHAWLTTWLQHFPPQQLFVVLVYNEDKKLVGAAPLKISKSQRGFAHRLIRHVQFIGTDPSVYDWMKFIMLPGEDSEAIIEQIAAQLIAAQSQWDVLDLQFGMFPDELNLLSRFLSPHCYTRELTHTMSIPYISLPESLEAFEEATRKKGYKKDLKRMRNHMHRDFPDAEIRLEHLSPSEETDKVLEAFFERHTAYWRERGCRNNFSRYPGLEAFYKAAFNRMYIAGADLPHIQFSVLKLGEHVLSYEMGMWQGNGYLGHMTSYTPDFKKYRPGVLHIEAVLHHAIRNGGEYFEFGRGDEPYKMQWTKLHRELWNLTMIRTQQAKMLWQMDFWLKKLMNEKQAIRSLMPVLKLFTS